VTVLHALLGGERLRRRRGTVNRLAGRGGFAQGGLGQRAIGQEASLEPARFIAIERTSEFFARLRLVLARLTHL